MTFTLSSSGAIITEGATELVLAHNSMLHPQSSTYPVLVKQPGATTPAFLALVAGEQGMAFHVRRLSGWLCAERRG